MVPSLAPPPGDYTAPVALVFVTRSLLAEHWEITDAVSALLIVQGAPGALAVIMAGTLALT